MKTNELLDRLELLYPDNSLLSDLRRLLADDDQYSLFRLIKNLNDTHLVEAIRKVNQRSDFNGDSFSRGQIKSKQWLVNELENLDLNLGTVFLCAGWYATLAAMLLESKCRIDKIRSFDVDDTCLDIANTFNKPYILDNWKFKATTLDIHNMQYPLSYSTFRSDGTTVELTEDPTTIINTSCEHIENFKSWYDRIPAGKIVVLQTNDYFEIEDHINCSSSLEEFATTTPITEVLYQGELQLPKYTRYMRIGIK